MEDMAAGQDAELEVKTSGWWVGKGYHSSIKLLLMAEILHHLGCMKRYKLMGKTTYQLVQDFSHQQ